MVPPWACFRPRFPNSETALLRPAVHRVMQIHALEREVVFGFHLHHYLFDRAHLGIAAGTAHHQRGRLLGLRLDEVVLAQAHGRAAIQGGDVIKAILLNRDLRANPIACAGLQLQLLRAVQHQDAIGQRPVGLDGHFRLRALDRAKIAALLLDGVSNSQPAGIVVGDANPLHRGQLDHRQLEAFRGQPSRRDEVLGRFAEPCKQKIETRAAFPREHGRFFPLRGAVEARMNLCLHRFDPAHGRRDGLVAALANGGVARLHDDFVERFRARAAGGAPQQRRAVAQKSGRGSNQPNQSADAHDAERGKPRKYWTRGQSPGFGKASDLGRIGGEKFQKRVFRRVLFGEREQALLERGELPLGAPRDLAPVQTAQRQHHAGGDSGRQRKEKRHARDQHAERRKSRGACAQRQQSASRPAQPLPSRPGRASTARRRRRCLTSARYEPRI